MPLYEYECEKHGRFDRIEPVRPWGIDSKYFAAPCPKCKQFGSGVISSFFHMWRNPFPTRGNIAGDGEGFQTKII